MWKGAAFVSILSALAVASPAQSLFAPLSGARAGDPESPWVVRSREVRLQIGRLPGASARDAHRGVLPRAGHRVVLNLFPDVVVRARMTRSERDGASFVWVGKVEGQPFGDVVLSVYDGVLSGSVVSPRGAYRIRFDGRRQVVEELDHDAFAEDGCFREAPPSALEPPRDPVPAKDDGSLLDVLVVYTPAAAAAAGGSAAMLSQVNLAVAETNTGYQNSGVIQRLRLAGAAEVSYVEAGDIGVDLDRVTCPHGHVCNGSVLDPDGYLDEVQGLRDVYKADLVSLITNTPGSPYCGIAWLMQGNDPGFAPHAYSVVERSCMTGYYSFGHELGHNMGLNHAREDGGGPGAFSYSFGYKWTGYRTVMAYAPGTRILYFSNPNVLHLGLPTGVAEASASSAYNALSLNNTRTTVANWRQGQHARHPRDRAERRRELERRLRADGDLDDDVPPGGRARPAGLHEHERDRLPRHRPGLAGLLRLVGVADARLLVAHQGLRQARRLEPEPPDERRRESRVPRLRRERRPLLDHALSAQTIGSGFRGLAGRIGCAAGRGAGATLSRHARRTAGTWPGKARSEGSSSAANQPISSTSFGSVLAWSPPRTVAWK